MPPRRPRGRPPGPGTGASASLRARRITGVLQGQLAGNLAQPVALAAVGVAVRAARVATLGIDRGWVPPELGVGVDPRTVARTEPAADFPGMLRGRVPVLEQAGLEALGRERRSGQLDAVHHV